MGWKVGEGAGRERGLEKKEGGIGERVRNWW